MNPEDKMEEDVISVSEECCEDMENDGEDFISECRKYRKNM